MKKGLIFWASAAVASAITLTGCGNGLSDGTDGRYRQIERLARPAVNEGLVLTNDSLNAFNSIAPSADLADASSSVLTEAALVLEVVTGMLNGGVSVSRVVQEFLPDVMRFKIDEMGATAQSNRTNSPTTLAEQGYTFCNNVAAPGDYPLLCSGRKIRDDVIDVTLNYIAVSTVASITPGSFTVSDGISYETGHDALLSEFPFLAPPR